MSRKERFFDDLMFGLRLISESVSRASVLSMKVLYMYVRFANGPESRFYREENLLC
jgi:hypothetical protein